MKILYLAQCMNNPSGGTKVMYQHVDILNELGHEAAIWHDEEGFRYRYFDNDTRIVTGKNIVPDVIVSSPTVHNLGEFRTIIFDQNTYYGMSYGHNRPETIMVVSEDNRRYHELLHPDIRVVHIPNFVDGDIFRPAKTKEKILAMDGRKNWEDLAQVLGMLKPYIDGHGWTVLGFLDSHEGEVADVLSRTAIQLQFGLREGLCLMPMEAMACGCRVIGYHGQGGREYINPEVWDTIDMGDIQQFAHTVKKRMIEFEENPLPVPGAREFILGKYTRERTKEALRAFYDSIG